MNKTDCILLKYYKGVLRFKSVFMDYTDSLIPFIYIHKKKRWDILK